MVFPRSFLGITLLNLPALCAELQQAARKFIWNQMLSLPRFYRQSFLLTHVQRVNSTWAVMHAGKQANLPAF